MSTENIIPIRPNYYDDGYLRIEYESYFISVNEESIKLSKIEFLVMSRLAQLPERVVTYRDLWDHVWGNDDVNVETLKVHVYRLRRIFEPYGIKIETMVSVGYRLVPFAGN